MFEKNDITIYNSIYAKYSYYNEDIIRNLSSGILLEECQSDDNCSAQWNNDFAGLIFVQEYGSLSILVRGGNAEGCEFAGIWSVKDGPTSSWLIYPSPRSSVWTYENNIEFQNDTYNLFLDTPDL